MKYTHQSANVITTPNETTMMLEKLQPSACVMACAADKVPSTVSPSAMIASSEYLSAMWCAYHGVAPPSRTPLRSATTGPPQSMIETTSAATANATGSSGRKIKRTQNNWATPINSTYVFATR